MSQLDFSVSFDTLSDHAETFSKLQEGFLEFCEKHSQEIDENDEVYFRACGDRCIMQDLASRIVVHLSNIDDNAIVSVNWDDGSDCGVIIHALGKTAERSEGIEELAKAVLKNAGVEFCENDDLNEMAEENGLWDYISEQRDKWAEELVAGLK